MSIQDERYEDARAAAQGQSSTLDNPVWWSLAGAHRSLGVFHGNAARYADDVSRFAAVQNPTRDGDWEDLRELTDSGTVAVIGPSPQAIPTNWKIVRHLRAVQMTEAGARSQFDGRNEGIVELAPSDMEEMLELVATTEPGPFSPRTIAMGAYFGIRAPEDSRLVAMSGERFAPNQWREVSAVCTDPAHRGRGYAHRLVNATAAHIHGGGLTAFLHVEVANPAVRLYRSTGFDVRREIDIVVIRTASSAQ